MNNHFLFYPAIVLIAATISTGCAVTPQTSSFYRPQVVYSDALPAPIISTTPLPAPQNEVMGNPTVPGYFWIPGVWLWEENHYVWQAGYWAAPRPSYTWVPHRWHQAGRVWQMDGGYWLRNE